MCQLNVNRGNPRDGCYFHQESNNKRMKGKEDYFCFGVATKRAVLNGSAKCQFKVIP